jgi:hypothetical protein
LRPVIKKDWKPDLLKVSKMASSKESNKVSSKVSNKENNLETDLNEVKETVVK